MANFSTNVLRHSAQWSVTEDRIQRISGFPDDVLFEWQEGYEVLHFINRYMAYRQWSSQITFQKLESIIKTRLPFTVKTHKEVKEWLDTSFRR